MSHYRILHPRKYGGVKRERHEVVSAEEIPEWAIPSLVRSKFIEPFDPPAPDLDNLRKAELLAHATAVGVEVPDGLKVNEIRALLKEVN